MENPIAPAVEGGPLESEMKDVTFRSMTDQFLGNKVIREEEGNVDMEGGGEGGGVNPTPTDLPSSKVEMRDPFLEELPSREENEIEMEELQRNKRQRDEVERGRRKRRREEEHRGYKRSGDEPEKRQLRPRIPATYEEFNPEWENLEVWDEDGTVQN